MRGKRDDRRIHRAGRARERDPASERDPFAIEPIGVAATNLLADRLRELEHAGVIARENAPPPIATTLFHLTQRGEQLRPVLEALIRWGVPLMTEQNPGDTVRSHWRAWALGLMLTDRQPDASPVTIELQTSDHPIVIEARDGTIHTRLGPADSADATLASSCRVVLPVVMRLQNSAHEKPVDPACLLMVSA